jgi:hypothetical protein
MKRIAHLVASVVIAQCVFVANADAKPARCVVIGAGMAPYKGKCDFSADDGGSFSITPIGKPAFGGATVISVSVISPGMAEVRGLTPDGVNSRWGEAKRSNTDRACWVESDFKICVY